MSITYWNRPVLLRKRSLQVSDPLSRAWDIQSRHEPWVLDVVTSLCLTLSLFWMISLAQYCEQLFQLFLPSSLSTINDQIYCYLKKWCWIPHRKQRSRRESGSETCSFQTGLHWEVEAVWSPSVSTEAVRSCRSPSLTNGHEDSRGGRCGRWF